MLAVASLCLSGCDRQSGQNPQPAASTQPAASGQTAASAVAQEPLTGTLDRSHRGSRLPDLAFKSAAGTDAASPQLRLRQLHGPLLLNFWATWCGPCVAELPTLHKLAGHTLAGPELASRRELTVIAVSEDMGDAGKVSAFWRAHGLADWPLWLDPDGVATSQYEFSTLPTTIYYDANGREVWRYTGGRDWTGPGAAALLGEARAG